MTNESLKVGDSKVVEHKGRKYRVSIQYDGYVVIDTTDGDVAFSLPFVSRKPGNVEAMSVADAVSVALRKFG